MLRNNLFYFANIVAVALLFLFQNCSRVAIIEPATQAAKGSTVFDCHDPGCTKITQETASP